MSDSLRPHESQHPRPPCPSPTPGVYSYSCPSSQWCHPAISSFVVPFSSCSQFFPASASFPVSQLFASGGQSTGVSLVGNKKTSQNHPLKMDNHKLKPTSYLDIDIEVTQLCPTLCNPMNCSLPGSSVHGTFQARVLEWVAISFSRRSSRPRDRTRVSHIVGRHFTVWATLILHKVLMD